MSLIYMLIIQVKQSLLVTSKGGRIEQKLVDKIRKY